MAEDLSSVPRRLRRFYRRGQPIPEELAHIGEKKNPPMAQLPNKDFQSQQDAYSDSRENDEAMHEPWMNATSPHAFPNSPAQNENAQNEKTLSRRERLKMQQSPGPNPNFNPIPASPAQQTGMFSRILQSGNSPPKPLDHALGLQGKQQFEERLPSAGEKIIQPAPANPAPALSTNSDLANTLNELKRLAAANPDNSKSQPPSSSTSLSSFHFTPAEGAPNPVDASQSRGANLNPETMSPRQRMEMRRMRSGESGFGAAGSEGMKSASTPPPSTSSSTMPSNVPAHIRRRAGQVVQPGEEAESLEDGNENTGGLPPEKEDLDFKDLLDSSSSKKKKPAGKEKSEDEDEDFSLGENLDEDIGPLEDEK